MSSSLVVDSLPPRGAAEGPVAMKQQNQQQQRQRGQQKNKDKMNFIGGKIPAALSLRGSNALRGGRRTYNAMCLNDNWCVLLSYYILLLYTFLPLLLFGCVLLVLCLFARLFSVCFVVCLFMRLLICLFVCVFVLPCVYLFECLFVLLFIWFFTFLFICVYMLAASTPSALLRLFFLCRCLYISCLFFGCMWSLLQVRRAFEPPFKRRAASVHRSR